MAGILISALLALSGLAACAQPAPPAGARLLGNLRIMWGDPCWNSKISPDGRHLATLVVAEGTRSGTAVVRDGAIGPQFDEIPAGCGCNYLTFSPDSARLAYPAKRGERWFVVVDGKEEGPYEEVAVHSLTFSRDGTRLAYWARRGGTPVMVVDGKADEAPGAVRDIQFDSTGKRLAYIAMRDAGKKWCFVVDCKPGAWFDEVRAATFDSEYDRALFTPVGDRAVEVGRLGDRCTVSVEGRKPWSTTGDCTRCIRLSRDGARGLGRPTEGCNAAFSPDGVHLAQWAKRGDRVALLYDGKITLTYRHYGNPGVFDTPVFSTDGSHWAVRTTIPGPDSYQSALIVDGKEVSRARETGWAAFSPDGRRWAHCERNGDSVSAHLGGKLVATVQPARAVGDPVLGMAFSPDSRHAAFAIGFMGDAVHVFLDGREIGVAPEVAGLKFSPDSRHLLWCAGGAGAWQAMVDGRAGAHFAAALGQDGEQATHPSAPVFHFSAPDRVNYLVTSVPYGDDDGDQVERGRTRKDLPVYLVEETLGP